MGLESSPKPMNSSKSKLVKSTSHSDRMFSINHSLIWLTKPRNFKKCVLQGKKLVIAFIIVNIQKSCNMPQTKPIVSIENVVASASVDQKMDLNEITRNFPDVEYHPDQFPGLVRLSPKAIPRREGIGQSEPLLPAARHGPDS